MREINRIRELKSGFQTSRNALSTEVYEHLVEYDNDNEEDEDTCSRDGRQLECDRKFVIDCYDVIFLSRLPEEQWNQVVLAVMGGSIYVTAGRDRDGISELWHCPGRTKTLS